LGDHAKNRLEFLKILTIWVTLRKDALRLLIQVAHEELRRYLLTLHVWVLLELMTDLLLVELHGHGPGLILDFQYPHRVEALGVVHPRLENVVTLRMIITGPLILRLLLDDLRVLIVQLASCLLRVLLGAAWTLRRKNLALHTHLRRRRLEVSSLHRVILLESHVHHASWRRGFTMSIMRLGCISHHRGTLIKVLHAPLGKGIREILVIQRLF
jgi:hypothetical protein